MIEKKQTNVEKGTRKIRRGATTTGKVKRIREVPLYRTSGNVTMATNGARYRFPNPYGAKQITFFGIASRLTSAGYTLNVDTVTTIPSNGSVYELVSDTTKQIVITGSSSASTLFGLPDGTQTSIANGEYELVSGTGDATIIINSTSTPGVSIRVDLFGMAQLTPSFYFTPQTSTSVGLAGPKQKIIQAGKWFLVVDENASGSTPEYRARSIETTLVNIDWPNSSTIVARAEVVDYGPDYFEVDVTLAANWIIDGNFMCV